MKGFFSFVVAVLFAAGGHLFAAPTDDQIRSSSQTLGVPYAELKAFVESFQKTDVKDAITIDASKLCSEYLASELAANNKYKGKNVLLTGKVEEIKTNYKGDYYAQLEGANKGYSPYTIDVYFASSALNRLANISAGQTIKVVAKCTGEKGFMSFVLKDATFAN